MMKQPEGVAPDAPRRVAATGYQLPPRVGGALVLAAAGTVVWLGMRIAVPYTAYLPVTIPYFAAILAGLGLLLLVSSRAAIVLLLAFGATWRFIDLPLSHVLGSVLVSQVGNRFGGTDLVEIYTPILVGAAAFALAVWRRPPGRTADGRRILATRVVNGLAVPAFVLGPPLGLVAWLSFAPGDIYGRPLGAGLIVGGLGLLLFAGYAGFHRLVDRPELAAVLAAVWSIVTVAALFLA